MSHRLRTVWVGGVIAVILATVATAAPPIFKEQNRTYGNSVNASSCSEIENGTICRNVSASENYDVKGTYENTEASINSSRYQYNPDDGSYSNGYRELRCSISAKAITVAPRGAKLEVLLDPNEPGCYTYGYRDSWDPINGYLYEPWSYTVPMNIVGEWLDPFNYTESISNQKNAYYDGWSGVTTNTVQHCKYSWGDGMRAGGFSVNARSWAFEGPYGPAMGYFSLSICNSNTNLN